MELNENTGPVHNTLMMLTVRLEVGVISTEKRH